MRQDDKTNLVLAKERVSPSPTNAPNLVPMVVVVVVVVVWGGVWDGVCVMWGVWRVACGVRRVARGVV